MGTQEVKKRFRDLLSDQEQYRGHLPNQFTATEFISEMLGMNLEDDVPLAAEEK